MPQTPTPPPSDFATQVESSAAIILAASIKLLDRLYVEPNERRHFDPPFDLSTAKRLFLTTCLMNVQFAGASLLRMRDHLRAEAALPQPPSDGMRHIMLASLVAEQSMWRRRLGEALSRLILFSSSNTDVHYFHYLLLHEANEAEFEIKNIDADFGASSESLRRRAADLRARASALSVGVPVWYAEGKPGKLKPVSAAELHRAALALATPSERTSLAHSYSHGFSAPSALIHFSTGAQRAQSDDDDLRLAHAVILLLAYNIAHRAADLAGIAEEVNLGAPPPHGVTSLPQVGDFVVVILDREHVYLAEVTGWKSQSGPIGGVRVRFLDEVPYPGIVEDEFPSDIVQLFLSRSGLIEQLLQLHPEIATWTSEEQRADSTRKAAVEAWQVGMKRFFLRGIARPREGAPVDAPQRPTTDRPGTT